jgi:uncharacterized membrane protein
MPDFVYIILGLVFTSIPFIIAALLAIGLPIFMVGLNSSPVLGAVSMLLLFLLETALVYLVALKIRITIYPQDLLFVPIALVALARLLRPGGMRRLPRSLWILAGLMALSFIFGLAKYGTTAGVEFRSDFYFMTGIFYFSSFEWSNRQISRVLNWLFPIALIIILIVCYRWLADAYHLDWVDPLWRIDTFITNSPLRVVNAQQTLLLGQALILLIFAMATGNSLAGWRFLVPLLALTVLVLQHRSVWVASFLPALMAFALVRQSQSKLAARVAVMAAVTTIVVIPLLVSGKFSTATSSVAESAENATSTTGGTFVGRVEGWNALLHQWSASGPRTWLAGNPYGSGYKRASEQAGGRDITFAPHNYFVQLLLRTGLIGLVAFLALHWRLLKSALRAAHEPHAGFTGYAMVGLLASNLLFDIPYSPNYLHGLVTGMILGLLLQYERQRAIGIYARPDSPTDAAKAASPEWGTAR